MQPAELRGETHTNDPTPHDNQRLSSCLSQLLAKESHGTLPDWVGIQLHTLVLDPLHKKLARN
jgi:hypothetical protein